jgi:hypothetical protein
MMESSHVDYKNHPSVFDKLMEPVQLFIEEQNQELVSVRKNVFFIVPGYAWSGKIEKCSPYVQA